MSQEEVVELGVAGFGPEDVPRRPHRAALVIRLGPATTFVELKNAAPGHRIQTRVRTAGLQDALSGCSVLGAYRANARSVAQWAWLT